MIKKFNIVLFLWLAFFGACSAFAQSVSLNTERNFYSIGQIVVVNVELNTGSQNINAAQGTINLPEDYFDVGKIYTGDSIFSLWPEKPKAEYGKIKFAGGIPGGFAKAHGSIFKFELIPKKNGVAALVPDKFDILLNDGIGTKLEPVLKSLTLRIDPGAEKHDNPKMVDDIPPEPFTPVVSRLPGVANNRFFISFSTVDRETGISYYSVREEVAGAPILLPLFSWREAETPYILKYQHLPTRILVRAYDGAGNYREAYANKPMDSVGRNIVFISTIIALAVLLWILNRKKSYNKKSRK